MAGLYDISSTFFVTLLNRLGVKPPPPLGFQLVNTVQPVSIVDQDVQLNVNSTDVIFSTPFSTGMQAAPVINTILADTGQLAAGSWQFLVYLEGIDPALNAQVGLQHRDAANAVNIWDLQIQGQNGNIFPRQFQFAKTVALNERLRVLCVVAGGAGSRYHANIFAKQLS